MHDSKSLMKENFLAMLNMQDELNKVIRQDWISAEFPFLRAAFVESSEALEHYGWKWWKKQLPDIVQVQIELVDILHFYLSDTLVVYEGNYKLSFDSIITDLEEEQSVLFDSLEYDLTSMSVPELLELLGGLAVCRRTSYRTLAIAMGKCNMSWSEAYKKYVSKNVLNLFRQKHGYKNGTYVKIWGSDEDNVRLSLIVEKLDFLNPNVIDVLNDALENEYAIVLKKSGFQS